MEDELLFNVYGQIVLAERNDEYWELSVVPDNGKKRKIHQIIITSDAEPKELERCLADAYNDLATLDNPYIRRIS